MTGKIKKLTDYTEAKKEIGIKERLLKISEKVIIDELETVYEKVFYLLKTYPLLRDSDRHLVFYYWRYVNKADLNSLNDETIYKLTNSETIRRVRQVIQHNYHLLMPTDPKILKRRKIKEQVMKKWMAQEYTI